jgi:hypothetical protein
VENQSRLDHHSNDSVIEHLQITRVLMKNGQDDLSRAVAIFKWSVFSSANA